MEQRSGAVGRVLLPRLKAEAVILGCRILYWLFVFGPYLF